MKTKHSGIALAWLAATLLLNACGGGGDSSTPATGGSTYTLSGQVQKGPFSIGSQVSVNELDKSLHFPVSVSADPSGKFLFAANYGSADYTAYSISATGTLSPISTTPAMGNPYFMAVGSAP